MLIANGPGPRLVKQALEKKTEVNGMISTGFCGALDRTLAVGDVVVDSQASPKGSTVISGEILSIDWVVTTAEEKAALHARTGAVAVEMESAAVAEKAREWAVPFYSVRAVSDTAADDLPLDFNRYRDAEGRFSRSWIAWAALSRPSAISGLLRLDRNCRAAAEALGEFFVHCQF